MKIIALAGRSCSGKSTIANYIKEIAAENFGDYRVIMFNADIEVQKLFDCDEILHQIMRKQDPNIISGGGEFHRNLHRQYFHEDPIYAQQIENHLHQKIFDIFCEQIKNNKDNKYLLFILDIPLLLSADYLPVISNFASIAIISHVDENIRFQRAIARWQKNNPELTEKQAAKAFADIDSKMPDLKLLEIELQGNNIEYIYINNNDSYENTMLKIEITEIMSGFL